MKVRLFCIFIFVFVVDALPGILLAQNWSNKVETSILALYQRNSEEVNERLKKSNEMSLKKGKKILEAIVPSTMNQQMEKINSDLKIRVIVKVKKNENIRLLSSSDVKINSVVNNIATVELPLNKLNTFAGNDIVESIVGGSSAELMTDLSMPYINAASARTNYQKSGKNIIIGVVDSGIDIAHEDFKNPDGTTRILYLWDQTSNAGSRPWGYSYGTEWTAAQINSGACTERDIDGHGTHVAGIAAGNGRATGNGQPNNVYVGVAPEADLVIVKVDLSGKGNLADIIDGLTWIGGIAKDLNKPWVANLSLGLKWGPHDGSSLFEEAIWGVTNQAGLGKGRMITVAAGNSNFTANVTNAYNRYHSSGYGDGSMNFTLKSLPNINNERVWLQIWYPEDENVSIKLTSPNGDHVYGPFSKNAGTNNPGTGGTFWPNSSTDGGISIHNEHWDENSSKNKSYPNTEANLIEIGLFDYYYPTDGLWYQLKPGTWTIELEGGSERWDAYIPDYRYISNRDVSFDLDSYDNSTTIFEPGNAFNTITVGSFVTKISWIDINGKTQPLAGHTVGDYAPSSSQGPTRDDRSKPDIYAPGAVIASSYSKDSGREDFLKAKDGKHCYDAGTSMAAPHVTGAIALLLEQNNDYSTTQIKEILYDSQTPDGYLDVLEALRVNGGTGTGIEDLITFYDGTGINPEYLIPNTTATYKAQFIDEYPYGDYIVGGLHWGVTFTHKNGTFNYMSGNSATPPNPSSWTFNVNSLPINYDWERNSAGDVIGQVYVYGTDNKGFSHTDSKKISIKHSTPNKAVVYNAKPATGKISLSYFADGATSYKIYYSTNEGNPTQNSLVTTNPNYTLTGLSNGTTYFILVQGLNGTNAGEFSNSIVRTPITTSGLITSNEIWPGVGNPTIVELEDNVSVENGVILTIGGNQLDTVQIRIPPLKSITVKNAGKIVANNARFRRSSENEPWGQILLQGNTNSFTNCLFIGGGSSNQAAVNIRSTGNSFTYCTFSNNYYGIISYWVSSGVRSNFTVNNCIFENNRHGLVISYANASVSNSIFRENKSSGIYVWGSTVNTFSNNKIFSNVTNIANEGNRGGLELMASSILYMDNNKLNRVWNNKSHEIYLDTDSKLYGNTGKNSIKDAENGYSATGKYIYSLSQTQVGENFINWTVPMSSNYWGGVPASGMFYGSVDFSSHLSIDPTGSGPNPTKVSGEGKQITSVLSSEMYQRTIPDESYSTSGGKGDKNLKPRMVEIRNWLRKNPNEIRNARFANEYYSLLLQDPDDQTQEKLPAKILIKELKERLKTLKSSQTKLPDAIEAAIQSSGQTAMQIEVDYLINQGRYTEAKTAISENLPFIEIKDIFISIKLSQMALAEREGKFTEALGILNEIKTVEPDANIKDFEGFTAPNYEIAESNLLSLTGLSSLKTPALQKPVASQTEKVTPSTIQIHQNYPNPFNPTTTIPFKLSKNGRVKIQVFNMTGQILSTLTDQIYEAGEHSIPFNAVNLASGVYFYKVTLDGKTYTNKMTVLK